jgi:DNA-binding CsgD family transcriptional regulator
VDRTSQIIDQIYGAALDVTAWPKVIQTIQNLFDCSAAGIYTADMESGRVALVELRGIDPGYLRHYIDEYLRENPWAKVPTLQRPGHIRTDNSLDEFYKSPGFYHGTALYNEWMKPQDFIHTLGTNLLIERRTQTKFFIYRPHRAGAFSAREIARFEWLCGHLTNAVRVARRLAQQEARAGATFEAVDRMEFGVVFLDEAGRVTQANRAAEDLFRQHDGLSVRNGILVATHREDGKRLTASVRAILDLHQGQAHAAPPSISLRRPGGKRPLRVAVVPLPQRFSDPFLMGRASVALILTDPESAPVIPVEWLQQHYALTATEARLAQCLTQGTPLRQAAEQLGLTYETARWYLKNIFQKTGTARQPELMRLLLTDKFIAAPSRGDAFN